MDQISFLFDMLQPIMALLLTLLFSLLANVFGNFFRILVIITFMAIALLSFLFEATMLGWIAIAIVFQYFAKIVQKSYLE